MLEYETPTSVDGGVIPDAIPERPLLPAAITLRPHHFQNALFQQALARLQSPEELALKDVQAYTSPELQRKVDRTYITDVIGITVEHAQSYQNRLEGFFRKLTELSDDASVLFTLAPDGICLATCIGSHCMASNTDPITKEEYRNGLFTSMVPVDIVKGEQSHIWQIQTSLMQAGFVMGEDWDHTIPVSYLVYDYERRSLSTRKPPVRKRVEFEGFVARVGALRRLIQPPVVEIVTKEDMQEAIRKSNVEHAYQTYLSMQARRSYRGLR